MTKKHTGYSIKNGVTQFAVAIITALTLAAPSHTSSYAQTRAQVLAESFAQPLAPEAPTSDGTHTLEATTSIATGFTFEPVVGGLSLPTAIAWAPDGRMFIAEKAGRVRVFQNGTLSPATFIDISAQANEFSDRGLLGIALHPSFPAQPYVYLLFTYDPPGATPDGAGARVSRLLRVSASSGNSNIAQAGSEVVLLGSNSTLANIGDPNSLTGPSSCEANGVPVRDCLPSDSSTHSIGSVVFGTDGALFVSNGDGAEFRYADARALRVQYLNSLSGKLLRIDPLTGNGLSSNPFFDGDPTSNQSKVYSYGLRNPFRITVNPVNGEVFIGDVGWNTWEEINTGRAKNFGWPCYEGSEQQPGYATADTTQPSCSLLYAQSTSAVQAPLYEYIHPANGGGGAAMAGAFYTGTVYPTQYRNALFVADYALNRIEFLTFDANGNATPNAFATNVVPNGPLPNGDVPPAGPVQLSAGPDGNLYVVLLNSRSATASEVRRLRYAGGNTPPLAIASANPAAASGPVPLVVAFSSNGSVDPDGQPLSYVWNFGDGTTSTQANPSKTYSQPGLFTVVLTVTDSAGSSHTSSAIAVNAGAPAITITAPISGARYNIGSAINFAATANDVEEGTIPASRIRWDVVLHHYAHVHFNFASFTGASGSYVVPDHGQGTWIELCATATDNTNLAGTRCVTLLPNTVTYRFESSPTAQRIAFDGNSYPTPFNQNVIVNSAIDVAAPSSQGGQVFAAWSDGGPRARNLVFGPASQTLTATYTTATPASCPGTGSILREYWNGITGYSVSDLTSNANYPNTPSGTQMLTSLEAPSNTSDNYGARIRGYVCPPVTGAYTFWLASDDSSQLFLSTDNNPANKQQIVNFAGWVPQKDWTRYPQQASRPITLTAGTRYYIEALHKEQNGGDQLSVAWHGPGLSAQIIPGQYLAPPITSTTPTTTSFVIYDDALASGWANWSSATMLDFNNASPVQAGSRSLRATTAAAYGTLALRAPNAINLTGYTSLNFWVYGGSSGNTLAAFIQDGDSTSPSTFVFFTTQANAWKKVSLPLVSFGSFAQIKRINIQDVSGQSGGQYVLDDVNLVGDSAPPATNDFVLYGDALAQGWSNWSSNATANFDNTSPVTVGTKSTLVNVAAAYGTFTLRGETGQSASAYTSLSFWVYGGPGGNTLAVFVQEGDSTPPSPFVFFATQANAWKKITLPMSGFGAVAQIKRVNFQDVGGQSGGQYVIDDLRLVGNAIALNAGVRAPEATHADLASAVLVARQTDAGTALTWQLRGMPNAKAMQIVAASSNNWREAQPLLRAAVGPQPGAYVDEAANGPRFYWLMIEREEGGALGIGPVQPDAQRAPIYLPLVNR